MLRGIKGATTTDCCIPVLLKFRKYTRRNFPQIQHEEDIVYLYSFPRSITRQMVNLSPYAIKLETWMRLKKIKYQVGISLFFIEACTKSTY